MIKKISVGQLKPGVFVHDFNCGWLHHPFLSNRISIASDEDIEQVIRHKIHEVYIDTELGLDVDDAPTKTEVDEEIQAQINQVGSTGSESQDPEALPGEAVAAARLLDDAKQKTRQLMDDVKLGKQLDMPLVESLVERMTESVLRNKDALVSLARIKNKDEYTYMHSLAVSALCISFGEHLKLAAKEIKSLGIGGLVHDIGKVKVPLEVLNKPGALSESEFEIIKEHVKHGDRILRENNNIDESSICVTLHHHERLDGTGYPCGLKGEEISRNGQMAAIVDIYDALTSERCYKDAMPPTDALKKLYEWSSAYLNQNLVKQFIAHLGIYPVGTVVRLRSGMIGVVIDHGERGSLYPVLRAAYDTKEGKFAPPIKIDLSKKLAGHDPDEIVGCESPEQWQIQPEKYLMMEGGTGNFSAADF